MMPKPSRAAQSKGSPWSTMSRPVTGIYVLFEDIEPSDWAGAGKLFGDATEKS
jgi:4-oxalocrotonate tautomerase